MITKKQYQSFIECPRYYYFNNVTKIIELDSFSEYLRKQSLSIRRCAYSYFGEYTFIEYNRDDYQSMADKTKEAINNGSSTIINATFIYKDIALIIDMLHKVNDSYDLFDIKASVKNHAINQDVMLLEYYVMFHQDYIHINSLNLLHINDQYVFQDSLNIQEFLKIDTLKLTTLLSIKETDEEKNLKSEDILNEEIEEEREKVFKGIEATLDKIKEYQLEDKTIAVSKCKRSHEKCSYFETCFKDIPTYNVFTLYNLQKPFAFYNKGYISYADVFNQLSDKDSLVKEQIDYTLNNRPLKLEKDKVYTFIHKLHYPIYHLDYETIQTSLPNIKGFKPNEMRITQYSIHKQSTIQGQPKHYKYLQESLYDNRKEVAEHLIKDLGKRGTILAYNAHYEAARTRELAYAVPEYQEELLKIASRIIDLEELFDDRSIYAKDMNGSDSIKHVLPGLLGDNTYNEIDCQNGQDAISMYDQLIHSNQASKEHKKLKRDLITYSTQDTYSMVLILDKIYDVLKERSDALEYYLNTVKVTKSNSKEIINQLIEYHLIESPVITNNHFYIEDECDFAYTNLRDAYYKAAKAIIKAYKK